LKKISFVRSRSVSVLFSFLATKQNFIFQIKIWNLKRAVAVAGMLWSHFFLVCCCCWNCGLLDLWNCLNYWISEIVLLGLNDVTKCSSMVILLYWSYILWLAFKLKYGNLYFSESFACKHGFLLQYYLASWVILDSRSLRFSSVGTKHCIPFHDPNIIVFWVVLSASYGYNILNYQQKYGLRV
jgi:hypothetical protein